MDFKSLIKQAEIRPISSEVVPASLPADGKWLLKDIASRFPSRVAAWVKCDHLSETLELASHSLDSSSFYGGRKIVMLVWQGDLVIDADLIDDDFGSLPVLVVHGNLTLHNWLRGGMPGFIGGTVHASGFIVGHYNDSALMVGGDLTAAGYLPRAKPYPDLPKIRPHQVAGAMTARQLNLIEADEAAMKAAFVEDVLLEDEDGTWIDERAILARSSSRAPVWRH